MNIKIPYSVSEDLKTKLIDFYNKSSLPWNERGVQTHKYVINKNILFDKLDIPLADEVHDFSNSLFTSLGFINTEVEPDFGDSLHVSENEGFCQIHIDTIDNNYKKLHHLRLNFMLLKPEEGGMPIVDDKEYQIEEGEAWMILSSMWKHGHTLVSGNKPRLILSIGKLVDPTELKQFLQKHL